MADIKEIYRSSIFDSSCQTIVNTVNCVGVMGRGLALEFKMRYPEMFDIYRNVCEKGLLRPGSLILYKASTPWILNIPTKDHWKYPSKIDFIKKGLAKFSETYEEKGITSIAFPKLGTTAGKLDWDDVRNIMYHYLGPLRNLQVEIYHFDPDSKDTLFDNMYQKIIWFNVEDYVQKIGIKKHQAILLRDAIADGSITTMLGLQSLDGIGEKSINAIYNFVQKSPNNIISNAERQMRLF